MFSTFRTLLAASVALPLVTGVAFAQTALTPAQPSVAPTASPAVTATAPAAPSASASTSATASVKPSKELGALKASPAEKKAKQEKTSAVTPSVDGKAAVKTAALAPKQHNVKKQTAKPAETAPKAGDATTAKKL
jgi:hypothetical protein